MLKRVVIINTRFCKQYIQVFCTNERKLSRNSKSLFEFSKCILGINAIRKKCSKYVGTKLTH